MLNKQEILTAERLLDLHEDGLGLEQGHPPETRVWNLLLTMQRYCERHSLDLRSIMHEVELFE